MIKVEDILHRKQRSFISERGECYSFGFIRFHVFKINCWVLKRNVKRVEGTFDLNWTRCSKSYLLLFLERESLYYT
jgi:hypothetical protein